MRISKEDTTTSCSIQESIGIRQSIVAKNDILLVYEACCVVFKVSAVASCEIEQRCYGVVTYHTIHHAAPRHTAGISKNNPTHDTNKSN